MRCLVEGEGAHGHLLIIPLSALGLEDFLSHASARSSVAAVAVYYKSHAWSNSLYGTSSLYSEPFKESARKVRFMVLFSWFNDFTGRDDELRKLNECLCLPGEHCRVALVGL